MTRHRWTAADDATLRALYPTHTAAEVAAVIGCGTKTTTQIANGASVTVHKMRG